MTLLEWAWLVVVIMGVGLVGLGLTIYRDPR